jgi:ERCC4-type nuclease
VILLDPRFGATKSASRAERAEAFKALLEGFGCSVELAQQTFGDAAFVGNGPEGPVTIGIELKTTQDLANSMQTGRLAGHQIPGLLESYRHVWLIVEGISRRGKSGVLEVPRGNGWQQFYLGQRPLFWADVEKFLTTLEVQGGVHVRRTRTSAESAQAIALLHDWWSKEWADHKGLKVDYQPPTPIAMRQRDDVEEAIFQMVRGLPGIGYDRASAIAKAFESPEDLWMAGESVWEDIPGIGKGTAKKIVALLHARKL